VTMDHARRCYRPAAFGREALRLAAAGAVALTCAACSLSFPMTSLVNDEPSSTAATTPKAISPLSAELGEEDWRRAKAALSVALDPQGSGAQVSWDNPDTALKGFFTPDGQPFVKNDEICRAFVARVSGQLVASSLQGTACRPSGGEWAITEIKPAKKG
jgi:surface antigen